MNSESDVTAANLKKLEGLLERNTVLLNRSDTCGHCHAFQPEFTKYKQISAPTHTVELESSALHAISSKKPALYKKVTARDGLYFPMVIIFIKKNDKVSKSVYQGPRTATAIKEEVTKKKTVKKTVKKTI
jgi:hypothetical protein